MRAVFLLLIVGLCPIEGFNPFTNYGLLKCYLLTGVNKSEISNYSPKATPSKNFLCFMKCYGENEGLIKNSRINPHNLEKMKFLPLGDKAKVDMCRKCLWKNLYVKNCKEMMKVKKCLDYLW